jgi:hypothetical protein
VSHQNNRHRCCPSPPLLLSSLHYIITITDIIVITVTTITNITVATMHARNGCVIIIIIIVMFSTETTSGGTPLWWARRSLAPGHSVTQYLIDIGAPDEELL